MFFRALKGCTCLEIVCIAGHYLVYWREILCALSEWELDVIWCRGYDSNRLGKVQGVIVLTQSVDIYLALWWFV